MDWEADRVTYANANAESVPKPDSVREVRAQLRQFLREFRKDNIAETFHYRELLLSNYDQKNYKIQIDFEDLNSFSPELTEKFRVNPSWHLPLFEEAAMEVVAMSKVPQIAREDMNPIQVQLINLVRTEISIRTLNADHISSLVRVPGIIITASKPMCMARKIKVQCSNCRIVEEYSRGRAFASIQLPRTCPNANSDSRNTDKPCPLDPWIVLPDKSDFEDTQRFKMQESPEDIPTGEMPRHIWLFCDRRLVNKVKPGSRVNVIGIYKIFESNFQSARNEKFDRSVRKPYMEVVGFEEMNVSQKKGTFLPEEEEQIRELSRNPEVQNMVTKSIAPAIWGNEDIKKSISCLMFGGSRKFLPDGMRLRGDINVLLLGDPSVAKSQFLKFVHEIAPIAVYTSGKGSSAAGLTASVIRDPGSGEFHLEGGAMVLADGGVVCIDEFDKMREGDRVAIHEAMEQQTISIAKAGITTILNSRTSVLAAANPIFGRYDDMRSTSENIEFETTILSRFDLIFIIRDVKDRERDSRLARHIMDLHINVNGTETDPSVEAPIDADLLSKYVAYARHKIRPRLSVAAADMLKNHYVSFRQDAKQRELESGEQSAIPLTVRQLESLIRIAESLAKMELSEEATEDHVKEAVRLFKVATLRAANQGSFGGEGALANKDFMEKVQKAERNIRRRLPIGSHTSIGKLVNEMKGRNLNESEVLRALDVMHSRGEIDYRQRRRQVYRLK